MRIVSDNCKTRVSGLCHELGYPLAAKEVLSQPGRAFKPPGGVLHASSSVEAPAGPSSSLLDMNQHEAFLWFEAKGVSEEGHRHQLCASLLGPR